jgi:dGTPase
VHGKQAALGVSAQKLISPKIFAPLAPFAVKKTNRMAHNTFYTDFDTATLDGSDRSPGYRTEFQVDRDRIIYTSAFRRLQSKTQVFLSGEYDFYRTRLTHSLEVAQIGRSICNSIQSHGAPLGEDFHIDPDLVEAACLSHDIGHPPFGHAGERTLHRLMHELGGFEGNAQTLRLLTQIIYAGNKGMNPTRAFIDATLKYKTLLGDTPDAPNHFLYDKQHDILDFVFDGNGFPSELTPGKKRNSLKSIECQIMDWADDTAYSLNDIVDGVNASFLNLEKLERWAESSGLDAEESEHLDGVLRAIRRGSIEAKMGSKIGKFIGAATIVEVPGDKFMSDRSNRYRFDLAIDPALKKESRLYKRIALDLVFRSQQLQQIDLKADRLLGKMFGLYRDLYIDPPEKPKSHISILPPETEALIWSEADQSSRARHICDHIAGMTDRFAARVYRRLFDADFGSIVDLV